jgi:hypothetical protein
MEMEEAGIAELRPVQQRAAARAAAAQARSAQPRQPAANQRACQRPGRLETETQTRGTQRTAGFAPS